MGVLCLLLAMSLLATGGCAKRKTPLANGEISRQETSQGNRAGGREGAEGGAGARGDAGVGGAAGADRTTSCDPRTIWGLCLDTLPRLACCSEAAVAWSQIVVGQQFRLGGALDPVNYAFPGFSGTAPGRQAVNAVDVVFPSGKRLQMSVDGGGRFGGMVTFDEEGVYRLALKALFADGDGPVRPVEGIAFDVAYRATPVDVPTAEQLFGPGHAMAGSETLALPADRASSFRVQFTDARGDPAAGRTLAFAVNGGSVATDARGVATLRFDPHGSPFGYKIQRLYPGLVVRTYREARVEGVTLRGLPGGSMEGMPSGGEIVFPLRDFLAKVYPSRFGDPRNPGIEWDSKDRVVRLGTVHLMADTGQVLLADGSVAFTAAVLMRDGQVYMNVTDLARLFDRVAWASLSPAGTLMLSAAELP